VVARLLEITGADRLLDVRELADLATQSHPGEAAGAAVRPTLRRPLWPEIGGL
jgi:hypothetical protein